MAIGHNYIAASFIGMNKSIHYIYRIKEKVIFYKKKNFFILPCQFFTSAQLCVIIYVGGRYVFFSVSWAQFLAAKPYLMYIPVGHRMSSLWAMT